MKSFNTILRSKSDSKKPPTFRIMKSSTKSKVDKIDLPENFNGQKVWAQYLQDIQNQGACGSCYAVSTTSCLADRFAILTNGQVKVNLSSYLMVVCNGVIDSGNILSLTSPEQINNNAHSQGACSGNTIENACEFLYKYGTLSLQCFSNSYLNKKGINLERNINQTTDLPKCEELVSRYYDKCTDSETYARFYRCMCYYAVPDNEEAIKREIYHFGPVVTGFIMYPSYIHKYNGRDIYMGPEEGEEGEGGHAVKIVGWGIKNDVKYWLIANSWGTSYGIGGYFRIKMGICDIEKNVMALIPDIPTFKMSVLDYTLQVDTKVEQERLWFGVDNKTGYRYVSLESMKISGITPTSLFDIKYLPDYEKFYAAKITDDMDAKYYYQLGNNKKDFVVNTLLLLVFIPFILSILIKKKKN